MRLRKALREAWSRLAAGAPPADRFDPARTAALPEPVRRWLGHAVTADTPLWGSVELSMRGRIRIGSWRSFTARQLLVPGAGFIWAATARIAGLPVTGYDRFTDGAGEMRWRLAGVIPAQSATGPDITRSAAARLAGESTCWVPTAFRSASWAPGASADSAVATWQVGDHRVEVELHVGASGQVAAVHMLRWGNPDGTGFGEHPFGVEILAERRFGTVTIPSQVRASWWWGTDRQADGEFFHAEITGARLR